MAESRSPQRAVTLGQSSLLTQSLQPFLRSGFCDLMSGTDRTRTFHQAAKTKGSSFRRDAKTKSPRRPLQRLDHPSHKAMARQAERGGYRITSSHKSLRPSLGIDSFGPLIRPLGLPIYVASSRLGSIHSLFVPIFFSASPRRLLNRYGFSLATSWSIASTLRIFSSNDSRASLRRISKVIPSNKPQLRLC
jgi:hypothetical protein